MGKNKKQRWAFFDFDGKLKSVSTIKIDKETAGEMADQDGCYSAIPESAIRSVMSVWEAQDRQK